ncbi:CRISPR-associated DxTHG motif protein [Pyrobaculum calidifontis]|uniref:CRISPR-associated protein, Csx1 family n=1 Tax=Pyrobaculum calidifontis (strain DSM 21063 / JCM 11548 / VA1) TaxID=410359 RepID=A3MSU0_PYRCJ|nr:CRISPR-associated DxTHG motif protein [Pyrobaculum calidifontis]ABO07707.1 CRISPR-associated protein, Csx1 family [Pyrobaculum calidifontis JCM 11548]
MRLLVATWGSPLTWRRARYTGVPPLNCPEGQTFTDLPCYRGVVDRVVVIALDSAAAAAAPRALVNEDALNCAREAGLSVRERGGDVEIFPAAEDYREWRRAVVNYVKCVAEASGGGEVDVVVAPAVGRLGMCRHVLRDPRAFLSISLAELYALLGGEAPSEIYLDTTHGVNYATTLAYELVHMLASLAVARGAAEAKVQTFNAVEAAGGEYEVARVYQANVRRIDLAAARATGGASGKVLRALALAAPLAVYYACREAEPPKAEEVVERFVQGVKIRAAEECAVEKPAVEPPEVVYGMLLAWEVCKAGWSNVVTEMRGDYFRKLSPLYETLVNEELAALNKLLTKRPAYCAPYYAFKNVGPEKWKRQRGCKGGKSPSATYGTSPRTPAS